MLFAAVYSALRLVLELIQLGGREETALKAEVLALRQQVRVLERQIKRARWQAGDRLVLSALRKRLPRSAWSVLLVQPGNGAGLASGSGAAEVGGLPRTIARRTAAAR